MALVAVNHRNIPPPGLSARAAELPPGAPIVVMIHGYRFSPSSPQHDPHRHILSLDLPAHARRAVSWPRALGFTADGDEGLCLAYGWESRGRLGAAYAAAADAGADLAQLIDHLAVTAQRPVGLIGHSLGARVALAALRRAAPGAVGRVVLLAAAELRRPAESAIASPAGLLAEVLNITSRENDLYDLALELALSGGRRRALGFGLSTPRPNWLDVQIDHPETVEALQRMGFAVPRRAARACHWSPYLRDGLFDLYRAALCRPESLPLARLAAALPQRPAPRWSRLLLGGVAPEGAAALQA